MQSTATHDLVQVRAENAKMRFGSHEKNL